MEAVCLLERWITGVKSGSVLSHQKMQVFPHVEIKSSNFCSQVDHMGGAVLLEHCPGLPEVSVLTSELVERGYG